MPIKADPRQRLNVVTDWAHRKNLQMAANLSHMKHKTQKAVMAAMQHERMLKPQHRQLDLTTTLRPVLTHFDGIIMHAIGLVTQPNAVLCNAVEVQQMGQQLQAQPISPKPGGIACHLRAGWASCLLHNQARLQNAIAAESKVRYLAQRHLPPVRSIWVAAAIAMRSPGT